MNLPEVLDRSYETDIINQKYDFIQEIVEEVVVNKAQKAELTDHVDRFLTHRILGIPIFAVVMYLVFQISQVWVGTPIADYLVAGIGPREMGLRSFMSGRRSFLW